MDLLDFMDALKIERAVLGGYDWGGRAACIVSALLPSRVVALVSGNSYNIQSIAHAMEPASPPEEAALWYQYYFHNERGRRGLTKNRREIARLLWRMWSPNWAFDDATFDRTACVVRQSRLCRRRHPFLSPSLRAAPGPAILATMRSKWGSRRSRPSRVPAITIDGDADGVNPGTAQHAKKFTGPHEHRIFKGAGHNLPQERPEEWARAVIDARAMANA